MPALFSSLLFIIVFVCPILTMRLMSEDKRLKVDQALLTAPVSLWGIVLGKFLAAFAIFALCMSLTFVQQLVFSIPLPNSMKHYQILPYHVLLFLDQQSQKVVV